MYALNPLSVIAFPLSLAFTASAMALDANEPDYDLKLLGKYVFFDTISNPKRMACVTRHDPDTGGRGSVSGVNLHQVAITGANPPDERCTNDGECYGVGPDHPVFFISWKNIISDVLPGK